MSDNEPLALSEGQLRRGCGVQIPGEVLEGRLGLGLLLAEEVHALAAQEGSCLGGDLEGLVRRALGGQLKDP